MGNSCSPIKDAIGKVFAGISPKNIVNVAWNALDGTRSKPMQFDVTEVDDSTILKSMLTGVNDGLHRLKKIIEPHNPETYKKLYANVKAAGKRNLALIGIDAIDSTDANHEFTKGEMIKFKSIGIHEILSALESEPNVQSNMHLDDDDATGLFNNDGSRNLNLVPIRQVIGQKMLGHMREKTRKIRGDATYSADAHAQLGQIVIDQLITDGVVNVNEEGVVLNPSYVEDIDTHASSEDQITNDKQILTGFPVISLNLDKFLDENDKGNKDKALELQNALEAGEVAEIAKISKTASETVNGVTAVHRMVVPSNEKSPVYGDAKPERVRTKDLGNSKSKDFRELPPKQQKELNALSLALKAIDKQLDVLNKNHRKTKAQTNEAVHLAMQRTATRTEIQELRREYGGNGMTQEHKETMNTLSNQEARINPFLTSLILNMQVKLQADVIGVEPEVTMRKVLADMGFTTTAEQNMIFGMFGGSTKDDFKSKIGQSISKTNPLLQLAMNFNKFLEKNGDSKTFKQELEVYRTTRMGYMATFLNEQMDKNLARAMTESAYAQEFDQEGELFIDMVATIRDQGLDVPVKAMQEEGYHRGLDFAVDFILKHRNEHGMMGGKATNQLLKWARTGSFGPKGLKVPTAKDGVFATVSLLYAAADIREAKGGSVKTHFRSKFDAAGSGIMLTAYQALGKYEAEGKGPIYKLLQSMGYIQGKNFNESDFNKLLDEENTSLVKDVYHILLNGLREASKLDAGAKEAYDTMVALEEMGIFRSLRDLVKPMTMITNYQAGDFTAVHGTAAELRGTVIEHLINDATPKSLAYIKTMIEKGDSTFYEDNKISELSAYNVANVEGINAAIEAYFIDGLAANMRSEIEDKMLPMFSDYRKNVKAGFSLIEDAWRDKTDDGSEDTTTFGILPAIAKMTMSRHEEKEYIAFENGEFSRVSDKERYNKFMKHHRKMLRKYSMPLTSKRQMVVHVDGKPWTVVLSEQPNGLTPSVNAIHGIDAAIFFLSHRDTIRELNELVKHGTPAEKKAAEIALKNASGMIHDANNGDIFYNNIYKKHYRKNSIHVNQKYDVQHELALTYASYEGKSNNFSSNAAQEAIAASLKGMTAKFDALEDVSDSTYRHFGFMDKKEFDAAEQEKYGDLEKYDANAEPSEDEVKTLDSEVNTEPEASLFFDISNKVARVAYGTVKNLLKRKHIIFDVETTGIVNGEEVGSEKDVQASEIHEATFIKRGPNQEDEVKTFYFTHTDISQGAKDTTFGEDMSIEEATEKMNERFNDQIEREGWESNEEVLAAIEAFIGKTPMIAQNAQFDFNSLNITSDQNGGSIKLSEKAARENDLLAAALYKKSEKGTKEFSKKKGENTLKAFYTQYVSDDWVDDDAHGSEYDTKQTVKLAEALFDDENKLYSKGNKTKPRTTTRSENTVQSLIEKWKGEKGSLGDFLRKFSNIVSAEDSAYDHASDLIELTNNGTLSEGELKQELEHEISHQKTTGFWGANPKDVDVDYLSKNMNKLIAKKDDILKAITDPAVIDRIEKFMAESDSTRAALEFIAIMDAEPTIREAMYDALENNSIMVRTRRLLKKLANWFKANNGEDFNFGQMLKSVDAIVKKGERFNEFNPEAAAEGRQNVSSVVKKKLEHKKKSPRAARAALEKELRVDHHKEFKQENRDSGAAKDLPGFYQWNIINNESGKLVQRLLYNIEPVSDGVIDNADEWLEKNFDIYKQNKIKLQGVWDGNDAVQSFKGYMNRPRLGRPEILNYFETTQMNAEQNAKDFRDREILKLNALISKARLDGKELTEKDISDLTEVSAKSAMFHLISKENDLARIFNADNHMDEIDKMIEELSKGIIAKNRVKHIEQIGMVLAGKLNAESAEYYNVEQMRIVDKADKAIVSRLVSLYALKHNDGSNTGLKIMKQNQNLKANLIATSSALYELTASVIDGSHDKLGFKESMVHEFFENPKQIIAINASDMAANRYPTKSGWKVIRPAKGGDYGILSRDRSSVTRQSGAGTTENYSLYDIIVPEETFMRGAKNAVKIKTLRGSKKSYHKLVMTKKELAMLEDNISNPADLLIRSHAQMMLVKDTQSVRDYIMYNELIEVHKTKAAVSKFENKLKKMKVEKRPWFIKKPKNMTMEEYLEKNPRIALHYKIPEYASSIDGFDKSFDLVRKDIHDMILGYADVEMFENNEVGKNTMFAIRQTVLAVKGHWIAQNPAKIAADIASNNVILSLKGVPFKDMAVNQTRAIKLSKQMSDMRSKLIALEFEVLKSKHLNDNTKLKGLEAKRDAIIKKINGHQFAPMYKNGMIQSMTTEILKKDESVVTGLQHNVENIFNLILENKKGDPSDIAKGIQWFADTGGSVDQFVVWLGQSAQNIEMFDGFVKDVGKNLEESGKRVQKKKKDEDMAKYLSEFVGSPDSEISRIGSYIVHMSDIAARYTLYKHLKNNPIKHDVSSNKNKKMTEAQIVTEVLDSFVDYKVNMPKELKFVSDHGILLFPSFWLRIQKVMYVLAKESPAKIAAGILLHEALGISVASYYDSNIISKMGDIVNLPPSITDPLDVILPVDFLQDVTSWM